MEKIRAADLLSEKDWESVRVHMQLLQKLNLEREMPPVRLTLTVDPLPERDRKAWHGGTMYISAKVYVGGRVDRQNFATAERAKVALERWRYGVEKIPQAPAEVEDSRKEIVPDNIGTVWPDTFSDSPLREWETSAKSGSIGRAGRLLRCISRLFIGSNR